MQNMLLIDTWRKHIQPNNLTFEVPECESAKGDIMASKVKSLIQQAINEINWIVN